MGEARCDDQLQEATRARMEQPQEVRHGQAAPRPRLRRLTEGGLSSRRIGHGTAGALDEKGTMTMPPPVVPGSLLHGAAEALEEEVKEASREPSAGLTGGCRREP